MQILELSGGSKYIVVCHLYIREEQLLINRFLINHRVQKTMVLASLCEVHWLGPSFIAVLVVSEETSK